MKNLKSVFVIAALVAAPLALAEGYGPGGKRGAGHAAHMQEKFGVSDEQLQQMRDIRENGGSREEMRAVLTAEQLEKLEQAHKRRPKSPH